VVQCDENGSSKYACGDNDADGLHDTATCDGSASPNTASYLTVFPSTSASRYVSPSPVNTALYSVFTESYTTVISADVQETTFTTTYESTITSTLSRATSTSDSAGATNAASKNAPTEKDKVTLTTGVLVAIIAGPIAAIAIGVGLFIWLRKRSSGKRNAIKLSDQAPYPPPNGPVGADQVHPYEVDVNEATGYPRNPQKYTYVAPVQQDNEINAVNGAYAAGQEKKWGEAVEMGGYEYGGLSSPGPRSPAPAYSQAAIAVELDGTSSMRGRGELGGH
jgi:hypothetical protein